MSDRRSTTWVNIEDMLKHIEAALPWVGKSGAGNLNNIVMTETELNVLRMKAGGSVRQLRKWFKTSGNADAQLEVNLIYPANETQY